MSGVWECLACGEIFADGVVHSCFTNRAGRSIGGVRSDSPSAGAGINRLGTGLATSGQGPATPASPNPAPSPFAQRAEIERLVTAFRDAVSVRTTRQNGRNETLLRQAELEELHARTALLNVIFPLAERGTPK